MRLIAVTEAGGRGLWSSAAEINVLGGPNPSLSRDSWNVTVDSAETTSGTNNLSTSAVDGDTATY